ncbi:MAG: hypothetical protein KAR20_10260, partial [Candidatus Heimdallarchaeota archaeon]|nr:hypothetical protein [Candidatus Heimdallarchaeota archaeon]
KDLNKSDVFFALNEEILVDKAKIKNLRTLYLNQQTWYKNGQEQAPALEGLYIAPTANSKDGFGKGFEDTDSKAWPTLGAKEREQILEENHSAINHPTAKLGFVLASPILLLNEGKRTIDISIEMEQNDIDCIETPTITRAIAIEINTALQKKYYWITAEGLLTLTKLNPSEKALKYLYKLLEDKSPNKLLSDLNQPDNGGNDIFEADDKVKIKEAFEFKCPFKLNLSGEKEWIIPKNSTVTFSKPGIYKLEITIELAPDEPAITFFNAEALMDNFKTQLPLVKIELDDDLKFPGLSEEYNPDCCLERVQDGKQIEISFYHYFRHLVITDTSIEVNVCGVKNFIVQNDENLQDVNSPVYPFGVRPNVIGF